MRIQRSALGLAIALALSFPALAGQATKKFDIPAGSKTVAVDVAVDDVRVNQVTLEVETVGSSNPLRKSGSEAKVRMDNNGSTEVEAGVALVLTDAEGNVVGAASCGTKVGWLKAGERDTCTADFGYVFRNLQNAKSLTVTLETRAKAK